MRSFPRRAWAVALVIAADLSVASCAAGGRSAAPRSGSNVIRADEIAGSTAANAYEVVRQLRPNWLRGRGASSSAGGAVLPVVYLGTVRQGGVEILRSFEIAAISELRFVNAVSATTRYGDGHAGGIIEVVLRRR